MGGAGFRSVRKPNRARGRVLLGSARSIHPPGFSPQKSAPSTRTLLWPFIVTPNITQKASGCPAFHDLRSTRRSPSGIQVNLRFAPWSAVNEYSCETGECGLNMFAAPGISEDQKKGDCFPTPGRAWSYFVCGIFRTQALTVPCVQ